MKKYSVLFLFPALLTSCISFNISREEALEVVGNIRKSLADGVDVSVYHQEVETINQTVSKKVNYIYSRAAQYYHTYTIESVPAGRVSEEWRFVKDEDVPVADPSDSSKTVVEKKKCIVYVVRTINEINIDNHEDQFSTYWQEYSDESWKVFADEYEKSILNSSNEALDHVENLLNDETSSLTIKSSDSNSLYVATSQEVEGNEKFVSKYEVNFSNNRLTSIINEVTETNKVTNSIQYSIGDIVYPTYKIN